MLITDRLEELAGPPVDPAPAMARVLGRHRRRRRLQGAVAGLAVAVVAVAGFALVDGGDRDARVELVDEPSEIEIRENERVLPPVGAMPSAWREALAIPYGDAVDQVGTDGALGPELVAPDVYGSWWVLDVHKSRIARFDAEGRFVKEIPFPDGAGGFQLPFALGDRLVASRGFSEQVLLATETGAELVDVGGGAHAWAHSDGESLYDGEGSALDFNEDGTVSVRASAIGRPTGDHYTVRVDRQTVTVTLVDAARELRINLAGLSVDAPVSVESAADAAGTIHLLVIADNAGVQHAGYLTVSRTGLVSELEQVRDPFGARDPGSPAHLRVIPGTTTAALTFADEDALRTFTRDGMDGPAKNTWPGDLEIDLDTGRVHAPGFNQFVTDRHPEVRSPTAAAEMLAGFDEQPDSEVETEMQEDDGSRAVVVATISGIPDDSVGAVLYTFVLERADDGFYRFVEGTWAQRCQPRRGHQDFESGACL